MRLLGLVVQRGAFLHRVGQRGRVDPPGEGLHLLDHVQQVAVVTVCHRDERLPGIVIQRQRRTEQLLGAGDEGAEGGVVETLEDEHLTAGQQRPVELEAGVFGGGADEDDRAGLDVGQERVLLSPVEPVDLVDEQQRALPALPPSSRRCAAWNTFRRSATPENVADSGSNARFVFSVRSRAMVVLPQPGGPHNSRCAPTIRPIGASSARR